MMQLWAFQRSAAMYFSKRTQRGQLDVPVTRARCPRLTSECFNIGDGAVARKVKLETAAGSGWVQ
jgi:hypothetical protein